MNQRYDKRMGLFVQLRRNSLILFFATICILSFQNCTQSGSISWTQGSSSQPSQNTSEHTNTGSSNSGDNGQGYDGKIRIVQHFDPNQKYWCKDHEVPESVLYQKADLDGWYYIKNYTEPCQSAPAVKVTGVVYDDTLKKATYLDQVYLAPKPIVVNSLEDANLADSNVYDGVCQDVNGLCSLRAAIEQASANATTADVEIRLPAGLYKLTSPLLLHLPVTVDGHQITLKGESSATTKIDGQGVTDLLIVDGDVGAAFISDITFQNGSNSQSNHGSAITTTNLFNAELNITRCQFDSNEKNPDVSAVLSGGQLNVRQSKFINNKSSFASAISVFGTKLLVEDSIVSNNAGMGIVVQNRTYQVTVRRTSIFNNGSVGIYLYECLNCSVENSTLYHNQGGLMVTTVHPVADTAYSVNVKNSTLVDNGKTSFGNIHLSFSQPSTQLLLNNSVVADHNATLPNCTSAGANHQIMATNSLSDDASCAWAGAGNITSVDPLLAPLAMTGGLTPTMLPLAGSPLIDAGDNASCLASDQRGLPRPVDKLGGGAICDIGAVEVQ